MINYITRFSTPVMYKGEEVQQLESRTLTRVLKVLASNNKIDLSFTKKDVDIQELNEHINRLSKSAPTKGDKMLLQAYKQKKTEIVGYLLDGLTLEKKLELIKSSNIVMLYKLQ
jgi:hypothetical protein